MTILHVLKSSIYSGAENVVCSIISGMPEGVDSVYMSASGPIETKLLELGIEHILVDEVNSDEIKKAVEKVHPDIIHAHDFGASLMCTRAVDDVPVIAHLHSNPNWIRKIHPKSLAYGTVCKKFAKILLVSDAIKKEAIFRDKMKDNTITVGNPFNMNKIQVLGYGAGTDNSKEKLEMYTSDMLFVGRLESEKGPEEFIKIVAQVKKEKPDVKAIMVGGGSLGRKCLNQVGKLGLTENIFFVGFQSNPYIFMNHTKISIIPSSFEGFGLVALENFTFGKPVVARPVGGLNDIVDDSCGAFAQSTEEFSKEAIKLLTDNDYYDKKSVGARKRAKAFNNYEDYVDGIKAIYDIVIKGE